MLGAGLFASPARAQGPSPAENAAPAPDSAVSSASQGYVIVLVVDADRPALMARLHAELGDVGLTVQEAPADLRAEALDSLLDGGHVVALVRIDEPGQAIEFRVRAPGSNELSRDRVQIRPRRADVAVVATVERLRARLIKLGVVAAPALPPAPLPPPPPPVLETFPRFSADVSAGASYSVGGFGLTPTLALGLRAHPKRWLAVGALAAFQPQAADFSASEGDVHARATMFGVISDFGLDVGRARLELGAGVALAILSLSGKASAPYGGRDVRSYSAVPLARAGFALHLAGPVSLRMQALAGVASPRADVRFADRTVAHWGRPIVLGLVGLEVGF